MPETISNVTAIKKFFEKDGGRPVDMKELRALAPADRTELGALAAKELGCEIQAAESVK